MNELQVTKPITASEAMASIACTFRADVGKVEVKDPATAASKAAHGLCQIPLLGLGPRQDHEAHQVADPKSYPILLVEDGPVRHAGNRKATELGAHVWVQLSLSL